VRLEGLGKLKSPVTSSGIESATFRFVALGLQIQRRRLLPYPFPNKTTIGRSATASVSEQTTNKKTAEQMLENERHNFYFETF
jgi:hypothetical protein